MIRTRAQQLLSSKFFQDTLVLQIGKIIVTLLGAVSAVIVTRLMGPAAYGYFRQSENFYNLWKTLDLTGVTASTNTRLGIAVGAKDEDEIHNLMAFYVQVSMITTIGLALLLALFGATVAQWLQGDAYIGTLAALLALCGPGDALYGLVILTMQSRRSFRMLALLQNANQLVLTTSMIAAVLINPIPLSLVLARLFFSYSTMIIAFIAYARLRRQDQTVPSMRAVIARVPHLSPRPYWRFGFANAIDKNIANLYLQIPILVVGMIGGSAAVGYLDLALRGMAYGSLLTSAVFENMQAVVPQLVGRKDYAKLWRNFVRVFAMLTLGGIIIYGLMALLARYIIPPVFGEEWLPVIPVLVPLAIYGAVTMASGIFGPLYRAFGMMRAAINVKLLALALGLPIGIALMNSSSGSDIEVAVSGAWTINILYVLSAGLTMAITLPVLRRKAKGTA
jgi:O-antigen/teichoic acid export membrane protein